MENKTLSLTDIIVGMSLFLLLVPVPAYISRVSQTGQFSWDGQNQSYKEQKIKNRLYNQKLDHLKKLANKDNDLLFSIPEQIDAWKRMGIISKKLYIESQAIPHFKKPTLFDLEKGIKSYESELQ